MSGRPSGTPPPFARQPSDIAGHHEIALAAVAATPQSKGGRAAGGWEVCLPTSTSSATTTTSIWKPMATGDAEAIESQIALAALRRAPRPQYVRFEAASEDEATSGVRVVINLANMTRSTYALDDADETAPLELDGTALSVRSTDKNSTFSEWCALADDVESATHRRLMRLTAAVGLGIITRGEQNPYKERIVAGEGEAVEAELIARCPELADIVIMTTRDCSVCGETFDLRDGIECTDTSTHRRGSTAGGSKPSPTKSDAAEAAVAHCSTGGGSKPSPKSEAEAETAAVAVAVHFLCRECVVGQIAFDLKQAAASNKPLRLTADAAKARCCPIGTGGGGDAAAAGGCSRGWRQSGLARLLPTPLFQRFADARTTQVIRDAERAAYDRAANASSFITSTAVLPPVPPSHTRITSRAEDPAEAEARAESRARRVEEVAELQEEILRARLLQSSVYQCPVCGGGPIVVSDCADLTNHADEAHGGNRCQFCNAFTENVEMMHAWDGRFHPDFRATATACGGDDATSAADSIEVIDPRWVCTTPACLAAGNSPVNPSLRCPRCAREDPSIADLLCASNARIYGEEIAPLATRLHAAVKASEGNSAFLSGDVAATYRGERCAQLGIYFMKEGRQRSTYAAACAAAPIVAARDAAGAISEGGLPGEVGTHTLSPLDDALPSMADDELASRKEEGVRTFRESEELAPFTTRVGFIRALEELGIDTMFTPPVFALLAPIVRIPMGKGALVLDSPPPTRGSSRRKHQHGKWVVLLPSFAPFTSAGVYPGCRLQLETESSVKRATFAVRAMNLALQPRVIEGVPGMVVRSDGYIKLGAGCGHPQIGDYVCKRRQEEDVFVVTGIMDDDDDDEDGAMVGVKRLDDENDDNTAWYVRSMVTLLYGPMEPWSKEGDIPDAPAGGTRGDGYSEMWAASAPSRSACYPAVWTSLGMSKLTVGTLLEKFMSAYSEADDAACAINLANAAAMAKVATLADANERNIALGNAFTFACRDCTTDAAHALLDLDGRGGVALDIDVVSQEGTRVFTPLVYLCTAWANTPLLATDSTAWANAAAVAQRLLSLEKETPVGKGRVNVNAIAEIRGTVAPIFEHAVRSMLMIITQNDWSKVVESLLDIGVFAKCFSPDLQECVQEWVRRCQTSQEMTTMCSLGRSLLRLRDRPSDAPEQRSCCCRKGHLMPRREAEEDDDWTCDGPFLFDGGCKSGLGCSGESGPRPARFECVGCNFDICATCAEAAGYDMNQPTTSLLAAVGVGDEDAAMRLLDEALRGSPAAGAASTTTHAARTVRVGNFSRPAATIDVEGSPQRSPRSPETASSEASEKTEAAQEIHPYFTEVDGDGSTALHWACNMNLQIIAIRIAKEAVPRGLDANKRSTDGATGLFWACYESMEDVALALIENDDVDVNTGIMLLDGTTPLFWACRNGMNKVALALLAKGADSTVAHKSGLTVLDVATAPTRVTVCGSIESTIDGEYTSRSNGFRNGRPVYSMNTRVGTHDIYWITPDDEGDSYGELWFASGKAHWVIEDDKCNLAYVQPAYVIDGSDDTCTSAKKKLGWLAEGEVSNDPRFMKRIDLVTHALEDRTCSDEVITLLEGTSSGVLKAKEGTGFAKIPSTEANYAKKLREINLAADAAEAKKANVIALQQTASQCVQTIQRLSRRFLGGEREAAAIRGYLEDFGGNIYRVKHIFDQFGGNIASSEFPSHSANELVRWLDVFTIFIDEEGPESEFGGEDELDALFEAFPEVIRNAASEFVVWEAHINATSSELLAHSERTTASATAPDNAVEAPLAMKTGNPTTKAPARVPRLRIGERRLLPTPPVQARVSVSVPLNIASRTMTVLDQAAFEEFVKVHPPVDNAAAADPTEVEEEVQDKGANVTSEMPSSEGAEATKEDCGHEADTKEADERSEQAGAMVEEHHADIGRGCALRRGEEGEHSAAVSMIRASTKSTSWITSKAYQLAREALKPRPELGWHVHLTTAGLEHMKQYLSVSAARRFEHITTKTVLKISNDDRSSNPYKLVTLDGGKIPKDPWYEPKHVTVVDGYVFKAGPDTRPTEGDLIVLTQSGLERFEQNGTCPPGSVTASTVFTVCRDDRSSNPFKLSNSSLLVNERDCPWLLENNLRLATDEEKAADRLQRARELLKACGVLDELAPNIEAALKKKKAADEAKAAAAVAGERAASAAAAAGSDVDAVDPEALTMTRAQFRAVFATCVELQISYARGLGAVSRGGSDDDSKYESTSGVIQNAAEVLALRFPATHRDVRTPLPNMLSTMIKANGGPNGGAQGLNAAMYQLQLHKSRVVDAGSNWDAGETLFGSLAVPLRWMHELLALVPPRSPNTIVLSSTKYTVDVPLAVETNRDEACSVALQSAINTLRRPEIRTIFDAGGGGNTAAMHASVDGLLDTLLEWYGGEAAAAGETTPYHSIPFATTVSQSEEEDSDTILSASSDEEDSDRSSSSSSDDGMPVVACCDRCGAHLQPAEGAPNCEGWFHQINTSIDLCTPCHEATGGVSSNEGDWQFVRTIEDLEGCSHQHEYRRGFDELKEWADDTFS